MADDTATWRTMGLPVAVALLLHGIVCAVVVAGRPEYLRDFRLNRNDDAIDYVCLGRNFWREGAYSRAEPPAGPDALRTPAGPAVDTRDLPVAQDLRGDRVLVLQERQLVDRVEHEVVRTIRVQVGVVETTDLGVAHVRHARREVAKLETCDDHSLRQIGLTREDVNQALRLPLTENSRLALDQYAFMRSRTCTI